MANTPQTYTSKFRTLTPEKLAAIIVNEADYHADAVKAARFELTARMLPMEELDRIYALAEERKGNPIDEINNEIDKTTPSVGMNTSSSIWGRTTILKLIFAYLILQTLYEALGHFLLYFTDTHRTSEDWILIVFPVIKIGLTALVIWIGTKGDTSVYFIAVTLISFVLIAAASNLYSIYQYQNLFQDSEIPAYLNADDFFTAGIKLLIPCFFFYLILRKDTRYACGLTREQLNAQKK